MYDLSIRWAFLLWEHGDFDLDLRPKCLTEKGACVNVLVVVVQFPILFTGLM